MLIKYYYIKYYYNIIINVNLVIINIKINIIKAK